MTVVFLLGIYLPKSLGYPPNQLDIPQITWIRFFISTTWVASFFVVFFCGSLEFFSAWWLRFWNFTDRLSLVFLEVGFYGTIAVSFQVGFYRFF